MPFIDTNTITLLIPELILVLLAAWVIVASVFKPSRYGWTLFCSVAFALALIALYRQDTALWDYLDQTEQRFSGPLFVDAFGHFGRWFAVLFGILFLPLAGMSTRDDLVGEFLGSFVVAIVGLMIVSTAGDAILLLLGLELISIPIYVLLFLARSDTRGPESTVKYFLLSILSSAMFLYGLSFVYGASGSTNLLEIQAALAELRPDAVGAATLPLGVILLFSGLAFKVAAVPFHFYAPDVYQGTTNSIAGLLAVLPKAAGVIATIRFAIAILPASIASPLLWQLMVIMAILSMTLGNACALWQTDLRRMLAYSSIAHAGYMLIGIAAGLASTESPGRYDGYGAALLYLTVYSFASLGTFATLASLSRDDSELTSLDQLSGLARKYPLSSGLIALFMFSLSGIPPLAGFWGKLTLFMSALPAANMAGTGPWFVALLIVAALNTAVGAGYYLRVVSKLYFSEAVQDARPVSLVPSGIMRVSAISCGILVLAAGLFPKSIVERSKQAGISAHPTTAVQPLSDVAIESDSTPEGQVARAR